MKRILVTGANKGIGFALAEAILGHAEDTFLFLGSRDAGRGQDAKAKLVAKQSAWGERIEVVELDVSQDESVARAAAKVRELTSSEDTPLYGVVNNAGIGQGSLQQVLNVNVVGVHRVCSAFLPLLQPQGRVVIVSSASGPNFVNLCSQEKQSFFLKKDVTWSEISALIEECLPLEGNDEAFEARGLWDGRAYGFSKALANSYTLMLANENPSLHVNACTPGFIETDLTRHYAESSGQTPTELGMKPPIAGTKAPMFLLFGELEGNGRYYGSDAVRSPMDTYRSPGDPPYEGD